MDQFPESIFYSATGFDEAIIGCTDDDVLVYDKHKVIQILARDMTMEEAIEFFDFNTGGSYIGEKTPIFITTVSSINEGIVF